MSSKNIRTLLKSHSIPFYERGGRIYADSMISGTELFEIVEDVTEWTRGELLGWLGY